MKKVTGLALMLGATLFLSGCYHDNVAVNNEPTVTPEVSVTSTPSATENTMKKEEVIVISMKAGGFEPKSVSVKVGTAVKFSNDDTVAHWPASALHPTHLVLPGFDSLKGVETGDSYTYTFEKVGTWKFHDHLNPSLFGSVTVTE